MTTEMVKEMEGLNQAIFHLVFLVIKLKEVKVWEPFVSHFRKVRITIQILIHFIADMWGRVLGNTRIQARIELLGKLISLWLWALKEIKGSQ